MRTECGNETHLRARLLTRAHAATECRYQSRLFSKKWLESKNLYHELPNHLQKYVVLE